MSLKTNMDKYFLRINTFYQDLLCFVMLYQTLRMLGAKSRANTDLILLVIVDQVENKRIFYSFVLLKSLLCVAYIELVTKEIIISIEH